MDVIYLVQLNNIYPKPTDSRQDLISKIFIKELIDSGHDLFSLFAIHKNLFIEVLADLIPFPVLDFISLDGYWDHVQKVTPSPNSEFLLDLDVVDIFKSELLYDYWKGTKYMVEKWHVWKYDVIRTIFENKLVLNNKSCRLLLNKFVNCGISPLNIKGICKFLSPKSVLDLTRSGLHLLGFIASKVDYYSDDDTSDTLVDMILSYKIPENTTRLKEGGHLVIIMGEEKPEDMEEKETIWVKIIQMNGEIGVIPVWIFKKG